MSTLLRHMPAPQPRETVLEPAAPQELPQHSLDHRRQPTMLPDEAGGPDAQ
jgi:hypothetical protein